MATFEFKATYQGSGKVDVAPLADKTAAADTAVAAIDYTDVAADVVSVDDSTLTTDWGILKGLIDDAVTAAAAADAASTSAVTVVFDTGTVTTYDKLKVAFDAILFAAKGSGVFAGDHEEEE